MSRNQRKEPFVLSAKYMSSRNTFRHRIKDRVQHKLLILKSSLSFGIEIFRCDLIDVLIRESVHEIVLICIEIGKRSEEFSLDTRCFGSL